MDKINKFIDDPENSPIGFYDPIVYIAVKLAISLGLIKYSKFSNCKLANKGQLLVNEMSLSKNIMIEETSKITYIVQRLNMDKVKRIIEKWGT
jgi:hypothetical protein